MTDLLNIQKAGAALKHIVAAKDAQIAAIAETRKYEARQLATNRDLTDALEAEGRDEGIRLIDGDAAAPQDARRARRIGKLNVEVRAIAAALPVLREREKHATANLEAAKGPFESAIIHLIAELQQPAVARLCEALAAMQPDLEILVACDSLRERHLGAKYTVPGGVAVPLAGGTIARKLVAAIPSRLRTDGLEVEQIDKAGRLHAANISHRIEEFSK